MFAEILKTQRLLLRCPLDHDAARIVELLNNWDVVKFLALAPYPYQHAHAEEFLVRSKKRKKMVDDAVYAISMGGGLLGVISVTPQSRGPNLGYWLGESYWGQGIMTEAVGAVVAAFFQPAENQLLTSGIFVGNDASLAVQRKFGFTTVGESSAMCLARGAEVRHVDTALTREKYEELQV